MRWILLFIVLSFFVNIESKICPKCQVPSFLITTPPLYNVPNQSLDIQACLYPKDINFNQKLSDISSTLTPVCVYIVPLRDDFLQFYYPLEDDSYFETFWNENGKRCLTYFNNAVLGFYNFEKYDNLPTDILFTCTRGFSDVSDDGREDRLSIFLSQIILSYIQEMEGKPSHQLKRCYDRDTDLVNSHWTLYNCMFAVMNRTFSVGPLSFNSFFVDDQSSSGFSHLQNTFLSAQARGEGCAVAQLNANGIIEVLKGATSKKYLDDGECTGTLNLYGFDLLCCCYSNVFNCLYTASPYRFNPDTTDHKEIGLRDDQFLCIKGFLNSTSPELKFRGSRKDILTDLAWNCYTILNITYDKDNVFNLSITFGAALGDNAKICDASDKNNVDGNSWQYVKSPWGFHFVYDVQKEPIEIVRCCRGNFCNHFGMFDLDGSYAWPKKFQYKMNEDWYMKCGYLPVDIFWNIFAKDNQTQECMRAISEEKTSELQAYLGGRDFVQYPLYVAKPRGEANFTGLLPFNVEPTFCFYAGIPYSSSLNRSGIMYIPRMVFGCQIKQSFTIPFMDAPNFNFHVHTYQQNVLRKLKKQYDPYFQCVTTKGASVELLSFLRIDKKERMVWFPICFTMIYRDFHQTFYRSGACTASESCCLLDVWSIDYSNLTNHYFNDTTNRYEGRQFILTVNHTYKCNSQWCKSDEMDAKCLFYSGWEYNPKELVELLNDRKMYSPSSAQTPVSLIVDTITGYDTSNFDENVRTRETTAIDISCVANNTCFTPESTFSKYLVSSSLPFCIWSPQRQYGADFSREIIVADASMKSDRIRFQMDCKFDYGKSVISKRETNDETKSYKLNSVVNKRRESKNEF